jgi:hypothetical protein
MATSRHKKEMKIKHSRIGRALSPAAGLRVPPIGGSFISVHSRKPVLRRRRLFVEFILSAVLEILRFAQNDNGEGLRVTGEAMTVEGLRMSGKGLGLRETILFGKILRFCTP